MNHDQDSKQVDILDDVVKIQAPHSNAYTLDRFPNSPLKRLAEAAEAAVENATRSFDNLMHIVQEPQDAAAQLCGGLMSKEYGAHERPHTEHHLYRGAARSRPAQGVGAGGYSHRENDQGRVDQGE